MDNIYLSLTREFNRGKVRAVVSSGQAVVLHRLAVMSKDGDWIVRENSEDLEFILKVLEKRKAVYRFGAPLDARWLEGGWSSHFEFFSDGIRVRCDFFSRAPRLAKREIDRIWEKCQGRDIPFLDLEDLLKVKLTQREKDYAVIGELARKLPMKRQLLYGRSARDLIALATGNPEVAERLKQLRPLLVHALDGDRDALEAELDKERRRFMRADEERLDAYARAARAWRERWPGLQPELRDIPLRQAHSRILQAAEGVLPCSVEGH